MADTDPMPDPSHGLLDREALIVVGVIVAFVEALVVALVAFGVDWSEGQQLALIAVVNTGLIAGLVVWTRRHLFSRRSAQLIAEASARTGRATVDVSEAERLVNGVEG